MVSAAHWISHISQTARLASAWNESRMMAVYYYLYINGSPPALCPRPRYFHFVTGVKFFLHTTPARGIAGKESRCRLDKFCAYLWTRMCKCTRWLNIISHRNSRIFLKSARKHMRLKNMISRFFFDIVTTFANKFRHGVASKIAILKNCENRMENFSSKFHIISYFMCFYQNYICI